LGKGFKTIELSKLVKIMSLLGSIDSDIRLFVIYRPHGEVDACSHENTDTNSQEFQEPVLSLGIHIS
jgi:hypothetical protein